jgi:CDP-diacylglycerol--glycerol-3-phosphate 3-phosphatidyltransferase
MGYKESRDGLKKFFENAMVPLLVLLNKAHITPNFVTWLGLFINLGGAFLIYKGFFVSGALVIIFASIFDMIDGSLARYTNQKSKFGGFLDSVTDRISEGALYLALLMYYLNLEIPDKTAVILCYVVVFSSFLVSYLRARAGGLKIDCSGGIFTRPERMVVILLGLLINQAVPALWIMAVLSTVTVIQRFLLVNEQAKHI